MHHPLTTGLAASILTAAYFAPMPKQEAVSPVPTATASDIHEELFEALDRADVEAVRALLSDDPVLCVVDPNAEPVMLSGSFSAESLVDLWSWGIEDPAATRILSSDVVAKTPSSTVVVLQLERPTNEVPHFRATSVLVKEKTDTGTVTRIRHLHISPATREDLK